jgi:hypothetical protein
LAWLLPAIFPEIQGDWLGRLDSRRDKGLYLEEVEEGQSKVWEPEEAWGGQGEGADAGQHSEKLLARGPQPNPAYNLDRQLPGRVEVGQHVEIILQAVANSMLANRRLPNGTGGGVGGDGVSPSPTRFPKALQAL